MCLHGYRNRSSTARPVNYRALEQGKEKPKVHFAIVGSQSLSSSGERAVHFFVTASPEEMTQQIAMQAQAQRDQQEQLRAQAQTIDLLKTMIQQVLEKVIFGAEKSAGVSARMESTSSG